MNSVLLHLAAMPVFGRSLTLTRTLTRTLTLNSNPNPNPNPIPNPSRYATVAPAICRSAPADPTQDALTQLAKVAARLL